MKYCSVPYKAIGACKAGNKAGFHVVGRKLPPNPKKNERRNGENRGRLFGL